MHPRPTPERVKHATQFSIPQIFLIEFDTMATQQFDVHPRMFVSRDVPFVFDVFPYGVDRRLTDGKRAISTLPCKLRLVTPA
jgi:hypothetical protein